MSNILYDQQNIGAAVDSVERGEKGDDVGLAVVARYGSHDLAKLLGVYLKTRQCRYAKQADVVAGGDDGVQAGKQIASLGRVGNVHALDDERDISLGQLLDDFVAVEVQAVENAEIGPLAL